MKKSLVIVESPAKAKTIEKYLGPGFTVKASVGHIKDLPKKTLGVDVENGFLPTYELIATKKKVVDDLRKAAEKADAIFLALDPDREGEAIAWHVAEEIGKKSKGALPKGKGKKGDSAKGESFGGKIQRILFNEITKKAIQEAVQKPMELNRPLYEAQQARRVLDRLVGYQISPILWEKVRRGLSAGRVQSVTVRIICEREQAIRAFKPEEYWSLEVNLMGSREPSFIAHLALYKDEKIEIKAEAESKKAVAALQKETFKLVKITKKERKRYPPPPFITSKLQQDAARKLGFTTKRIMMIAQQLYEGVELGAEGSVGLITYMRTDSIRVSDGALTEVRDFIEKQFGKSHLPEKAIIYKGKKGAQDAHEAIRPTSVAYHPQEIKEHLTAEQYKLYDLIWKRFVASQMVPAIYDQTLFEINAGLYGFRANGSIIKEAGYLAVYHEDREESGEEDEEGVLPLLTEGEVLKLLELIPKQHFTEPPPRFTEASLVKELEEKGIGRPSTYAAILSNIQDKEYAKKELGRFSPTDLGGITNDLLVGSFPDILSVEFTAKMEEELDDVEEGRRSYKDVLGDFYTPFSKTLVHAKEHMKDIKRQEIKTDLSCEKCKSPMVIKWGRRGEFIACSNYPECKNTREFTRHEGGEIKLTKLEVTGEFCGTCASQMVIKSGRFGKFLACSKYPECKTSRSISLGINCPKCEGGKVAERRTKKGRTFYGCTSYPNCKFATWDKPVKEKCPQCDSTFLLLKVSKKDGNRTLCPKECGYEKRDEGEPTPEKVPAA
ncbi:MAG: type I DNA topoisomerase [Deltaproteobacteria bacterium]|nr:type I DNA topoisomerase [Deltaproteobacteria bacterium]